MLIQTHPPVHLTYCLNIHPGESWAENFCAVREKALSVRDRVADATRPFGLGLRLSAVAANELNRPEALREFREFLAAENLYVFTINGFPYGRFHGTCVKENVYSPDWRTTQRRDYTMAMADILAALLPVGVAGSISTVPGSYKAWLAGEGDLHPMVRMLADAAVHLREIEERTGRHIALALEPEPDCFLETTREAVSFLTGCGADGAMEYLRRELGVPFAKTEAAWWEHVGVCLDTAHAAVEFEDPAESLHAYVRAGVKVAKVQLSAALRAKPTAEVRERLKSFCDPVYLHQVKARRAGGEIVSYPDLPDALAAAEAAGPGSQDDEWRIHFHVPLFWEGGDELGSTNALLAGEFAKRLRKGASPNVEIETYTFSVLPDFLHPADVCDGIAGEYGWVTKNLLTG